MCPWHRRIPMVLSTHRPHRSVSLAIHSDDRLLRALRYEPKCSGTQPMSFAMLGASFVGRTTHTRHPRDRRSQRTFLHHLIAAVRGCAQCCRPPPQATERRRPCLLFPAAMPNVARAAATTCPCNPPPPATTTHRRHPPPSPARALPDHGLATLWLRRSRGVRRRLCRSLARLRSRGSPWAALWGRRAQWRRRHHGRRRAQGRRPSHGQRRLRRRRRTCVTTSP